jgi:DNA adenine methylase
MSAFGYFGSKLRIASKLRGQLPPHNAWVELFCGSAAMTLAKEPAPIEVINDINDEIVNFFRQLRNHSEQLCQQIRLTPYARAELEQARIHEPGISDLERARRFFVSAMMAINGSFGDAPGGFSFSNSYERGGMEARVSRWQKMPDYLLSLVERLRRVRIEKKDALALFKDFKNRPGSLVYFDPPYLGPRSRGYDFDQSSDEYHQKIMEEVISAKCMIFISGYENALYNKCLVEGNGWSKQVIRATTRGNNGKNSEREELIWFNPIYRNALETQRIPLRLSEKESHNRKINPLRD